MVWNSKSKNWIPEFDFSRKIDINIIDLFFVEVEMITV